MQSTATRSAVIAGASMMLLAMVFQEVGASIAVLVFPQVGPIGAVALRLAFSALVLGVIARPTLRGLTRGNWYTVVGFGLALAAMNTSFYLALERIPLGITVTIEVLGPMILSIVLARRWLNALWVACAFGGVVLLSHGPLRLDPLGVVFALIAALMWAFYILGARRAGREFEGLSGLALAMAVGSVAVVPFAAATTGAVLVAPHVLAIGLGIALLSSAIPYALELLALRRVPASTFSVLLAFAPVVAALAGWLVLGQALTLVQWTGVLLVVGACIGAIRMTTRSSGAGPR